MHEKQPSAYFKDYLKSPLKLYLFFWMYFLNGLAGEKGIFWTLTDVLKWFVADYLRKKILFLNVFSNSLAPGHK